MADGLAIMAQGYIFLGMNDLAQESIAVLAANYPCLLYTSDAADERSSVDLGGRRLIKKNNTVYTSGRSEWSYTTIHTHRSHAQL